MIYQKSITMPANTAKENPVIETLEVNKGLIYQVTVVIPSGCVGLAGLRVIDGMYQAYPTTPEEWFIGDGTTYNFEDSYIKHEPPFSFEIQGYNLDDTYAHTLTILIGMEIKEVFMARFLPSYTYKQILEMFKQLQSVSEADLDLLLSGAVSWAQEE